MAAPANDLFANALEVVLVSGEYLSPAILNTEATQEPFEDTIDGGDDASGKTCWWRFAPTSTVVATVDTSQSTGTSVDTALSVYSGTGSGDLVRLGFNDDESTVFSSRLTNLTFTAGVTYWIRVDGWDPGISYRLHVSATAPPTPPPLTVSPLSAEVGATPGSVVATVSNGTPGDTFTVKIGGTTIASGVLDETGVAFEISIPVPALGAGTYSLVFTTGGGRSATTSLVVLTDALVTSSGTTTKANPTPPTTTVTQRWRLFYLDGTLGYTFTRNPKSWTNVHPPNDFTHDNTTAPDGQILTWQAAARPWRMEFVGFVDSQAEYEAFVFWSQLRRRFWLVDHRNRKWLVTFEQFDAQALTKPNRPWAHDYTMKTLVFAQG